jgi:hypothetical protein
MEENLRGVITHVLNHDISNCYYLTLSRQEEAKLLMANDTVLKELC